MKQMPTEGRKFNKVDRIWRNVMAKTVADPRVLLVSDRCFFPGLGAHSLVHE